MTGEERRAVLMHGTRTGKLATAGAGARPHVRPVWFVLDGDVPVFTTGADTVKGRRLRRDPRACLVVDDERPPYADVAVEGVDEVSEDLDEMRVWATRIAVRYMGADKAAEYGRRNAVPGELLVRLVPTRIHVEADVAD